MMRALIVDDKPENLYLLRALLEGEGWTVEEALNGAEALEKARVSPPEIIVSDLLMPVMDGYTLLRRWKADDRLRTIPFVVYTATYTSAKDERLALDLGADAFLIKPLEPDDFMDRIQGVLSQAASGGLPADREPIGDEAGLFKEYSEVLVNKLEAKVFELEKINLELQEEIKRREQTEVELVQARRDWEDIFQSMGQPTIIMDREHGIIAANKQCAELTGKPAGELIGAKCYEIFHEAGKRPDGCPTEALDESGSTAKVEREVEILGGHFLVSCTPILDGNGNIRKVIHTATDISKRKKMEETLRESEEKLKGISNSVQDAIILVGDTGEITYWNPAAERMFGYTVPEALRKNVHELLAPQEYHTAYSGGIAEFAETGQGAAIGRTIELEAVRSDGGTFPIELSLSSFQTDGRWHAVGSARDITDRKIAEQALKDSEELYRLTLSNISDAVFITNDNGEFTFICPNVDVLFGYSVDQVSSLKNIQELLGDDLFVSSQLEAAGEIRNIDRRIVDASGQRHDVLISVKRVSIGCGTRLYTCRDVTERKKAEEALRESEERLELALKGADLGLWDWSVQTGKQVFNHRWAEMLGYLPDEIEPNVTSFEQLVHPDDLEVAREKMRKHLDGDTPSYETELRLRTKSGEWKWILSRAKITERDENGRPSRVTGTHLDIAERKKVEEQAQRWSHVIENAQWGIVYSSGDLKTLEFMNPAFAEMHGYTVEELKGMPIVEVFAPEERTSLPDHIAVTHRKGHHVWESKHIRKDGSRFPVLVNATAVKDEQGQVMYRAVSIQDITERRLADDALRESERRYRDLWEKAPVMMISLDSQAHINFASDRICEELGYDRSELLGNTPFMFQTKESANYAESVVFPQFLKTGRVKDSPLQLVGKNGEVIDVLLSVTAERDAEGKVVRSRSVFIDVTEQKRAESALRESESRYRTLFESATDSICIFEAEGSDAGRIVAANKAAAEMHGYSVDEIIGLNISDLGTPELCLRDSNRAERLLGGEVLRQETAHQKKDGTVLPVEINARMIEMQGRRYVLSIDRDISERKAQEAELKRRDSQQRALLDNIPDLAWLKDQNCRFIAVNEPFAKSCGRNAEDLLGKTDLDIWPHNLAERYQADDREVMNTGSRRTVEEPLVDDDGQILWIETIKSPIKDGTGRTIGTAGIARDITERMKARQALEESEAKFRSLFMESTVGILLADPASTKFIYANPAVCDLLGYSEDELTELSVHDMHPEDQLEQIVAGFNALSQGDKASLEDVPFRRKDGAIIFVNLGRARITIDGAPHNVGFLTDVTQRRKDAEELERKTHDLRERYKELTCLYKISQLLDRPWSSLRELFASVLPFLPEAWQYPEITCARIRFDDLELVTDNFTKSDWTLSSEIVVSDVVRGLVEVSYLEEMPQEDQGPFLHEERDLIRAIAEHLGRAINRDKTHSALLESEQRFRAIFDNQHAVMLVIDPETGKIQDCSSGACIFYGCDKDTLTKKNMGEINILSPQEIAEKMRLAESERTQYFYFRHRLCNGEIRDVEVCSGPIVAGGKTLLFSVVNDVTERRLAEKNLLEAHQRLEMALEGGNIGFWDWFIESGKLVQDKRWLGQLGYSEGEVVQRIESWEDRIHPEDKPAVIEVLQGYLRGDLPDYEVEHRLRTKSGEWKWILTRGKVVQFDDSGKPSRMIGTHVEIHERKLAEQALRESEERFRQVAELAGDWIWEVDEKGLFRYSSGSVEQILGYSPVELVGRKHFWEFLEPHAEEESSEKAMDIFSAKKKFLRYVSPLISKDGSIVTVEASGAPVKDIDGKFLGYRGTSTDITERARAQESRELLAAVVEHAAEAVMVTDTQASIRYVNPAFERVTGYTSDEVLGSNPRLLKSGQHGESFYQNLWETITDGRVWSGNLINKKKNGSLFEEEVTISPIRGVDGKIANYVAVKRDVTKEALLQRQLIQSQKMEAIGTLAGGIAHDFNNIVFAITGYTELALEDLPADSQARWDLERVLGAGKRAGEMVKQILTFSRQGEPAREPLDISPIVKEGLKFLRASIPSTIEIRQHIEASLGKVHADPTQVHQVLMNLCTNASHAMRDTKGVLSVDLSGVELDAEYAAGNLALEPGKYIKLTVSDTGHGIPRGIVDRIFEPYFTTKEPGEGTGLGLAVIHGIIKDHGGAITVYSEPGQGSTFNVFLPVMRVEAKTGASPEIEPVPGGHERILLIDDEQVLVEMGQTILERLGYQVVTKTSPVEALELFRSDPQRFDLIMTDLTMPKMTGAELAAEIAALRPGMPLILCTGFGHGFTEEEAEEVGFQAVIKKPMSKKDVAKTVRKVLDQ